MKTLHLIEEFGHNDDPKVKELAQEFEAASCPFQGLRVRRQADEVFCEFRQLY